MKENTIETSSIFGTSSIKILSVDIINKDKYYSFEEALKEDFKVLHLKNQLTEKSLVVAISELESYKIVDNKITFKFTDKHTKSFSFGFKVN